MRNYSYEECRLVVKEMIDSLCLDMADQGVVTKSLSLVIEYSNEWEMKPAVGTASLTETANAYPIIIPHVLKLYDRITRRDLPIRKVSISCNSVEQLGFEQYNLFTDYKKKEKERNLQNAVIEIKKKYGKNAVVRGMDLLEAGTAIERNQQIGGHRSGE